MHTEAVRALRAFVKECSCTGRLRKWRGMILSAVATLSVFLQEEDEKDGKLKSGDLQTEMRRLIVDLEADDDAEAKVRLDSHIYVR